MSFCPENPIKGKLWEKNISVTFSIKRKFTGIHPTFYGNTISGDNTAAGAARIEKYLILNTNISRIDVTSHLCIIGFMVFLFVSN